MSKEKEFVTQPLTVKVTHAQKKLLELLNTAEIQDYADSLKSVHHLATYLIDPELVDLKASRYVHLLLDALNELSMEAT